MVLKYLDMAADAIREFEQAPQPAGYMSPQLALNAVLSARQAAEHGDAVNQLADQIKRLRGAVRLVSGSRMAPATKTVCSHIYQALGALAHGRSPAHGFVPFELVRLKLIELDNELQAVQGRLILMEPTRPAARAVGEALNHVAQLGEEFEHGGVFGEPWRTEGVMQEIEEILSAHQVPALAKARELIRQITEWARGNHPAGN